MDEEITADGTLNIMKYKVCILAAGTSKRESGQNNINPAILPLGDKSVLTRILNQFPKNTEFVIAIGNQGEQIKDYIDLVHSELNITLVDVDNWSGPQSSTAASLFACTNYLQSPFILTTANIIVKESIPLPDKNWVGLAPLPHALDTKDFCIAEISNDLITKFYNQINAQDLMRSCQDFMSILDNTLIGICGIKDFELFWKELEVIINYNIEPEKKLSMGIEKLINQKLHKIPFSYIDTGHNVGYEYANRLYDKNLVLSKKNEFIFFENDLVIKYFNEKNIISKRLERAKLLKGYIPNICMNNDNFYAYKKIPGRTLSNVVDNKLFKNLLNSYNNDLWKRKNLDSTKIIEFKDACLQFYKSKTETRIEEFYEKSKIIDKEERINGVIVPKLSDLMKNIDWDDLSNGVPVLFHGDFQPENIIITEENNHILIDWRQDFAGILEYGDIYYDLAKMKHALIISGEIIRNNQFEISKTDEGVEFQYLIKSNLNSYIPILNAFIKDNGYSIKKVNILASLIYLNISALHHNPYDDLLYYLGKLNLFLTQTN